VYSGVLRTVALATAIVNTSLHMPEHSNQPPRRSYRLGRRRQAMDRTRDRITAAAFELHATIGPSRTTIRAIAERAGVQRHTVYHHFPDLESLFRACTEHGIRETGMPSADRWRAIEDPVTRLRAALTELAAWYRANEGMLTTILYDVDPTAPPHSEADPFEIRMTEYLEALRLGWPEVAERQPALDAVLALVLRFETWHALTQSGLGDDAVVGILIGLVAGVADGSIPRSRAREGPRTEHLRG
jgi:AcrR family transcriptional regulator